MKKLFAFFAVALLALVLVACGGKETHGVGYGVVSGENVLVVEVDLKGGKVADATIEEYFGPKTWATVVVTEETLETLKNDVEQIGVDRNENPVYYAKLIKVDDKVFTVKNVDDVAVYYADGIPNLIKWLEVEENAKFYVDAILANKVGFVNEDLEKADANAKVGFSKRTNGYWAEGHPVGIGWAANIDKLIESIVGTDVSESAVKDGNQWKIGDLQTGSSLSSFPDYLDVVKRAYNNAK